jgi:hypothetical protein
MQKRRRTRDEDEARTPVPLIVAIVAIVALLVSVASFWIGDEFTAATVFGSGVLTACWCIFFWFVAPDQEEP